MNKKLILAAMAVILAAGSAQATNVTGATGGNGVYSVKPEKFSGIAGYRKYDNFTVTKGDKLNMEFVRPGDKTQPTAFVLRMVDFPDPLVPIIPTVSPFFTEKDTFFNASFLGYFLQGMR